MKDLIAVRILLPFLVISLILVSCDNQEQEEITVIDVVGNMNNTIDIKLSDIAETVQYIPLETNSECLISKGNKIVTTKDYFFIADGKNPLFVFDHEGKFIRKIGAVGKGPGEFQNCNQFHVDEETEEVYVFNQKEFVVYSWNGAYISTVKFPFGATSYHRSSNGDFAFLQSLMGPYSSTFKVFITNKALKVKGEISWEQKVNAAYSLSVGAQVQDWNNEIMAQIEFCDTIYAIKRSLLLPKIYLDFGNMRFTVDMLAVHDPVKLVSDIDNHIFSYDLATLNDIWGIKFSWKQNKYLGLLNPESNEIVFASKIDTAMGGFINDIDGGPGYFPSKRFKEDDWIVAIPAYNFQNMYQNGQFENTDLIYPNANKTLNKMASKLEADDNPVLMLLKKKMDPTKW